MWPRTWYGGDKKCPPCTLAWRRPQTDEQDGKAGSFSPAGFHYVVCRRRERSQRPWVFLRGTDGVLEVCSGQGEGFVSPQSRSGEPSVSSQSCWIQLRGVYLDTHANSLSRAPRRGKGASRVDRVYVQGRLAAVKRGGKDTSSWDQATGGDAMYPSPQSERIGPSWAAGQGGISAFGRRSCLWAGALGQAPWVCVPSVPFTEARQAPFPRRFHPMPGGGEYGTHFGALV